MVLLGACITGPAWCGDPNTLTEGEKRLEFELLFNGRDLRGWEPTSGDLKDGPWKVENGAIFFQGSLYPGELAHWSKAIPPDFELRFEWKQWKSTWPFEGHFVIGTHGAMTNGGWAGHLFCDYFAAGRSVTLRTDEIDVPIRFPGLSMSATPTKDARRSAGQWNEARMLCKGPFVEHWLNGEKIVEVDLRRGDWLKVDKSTPGNPLLDAWFKVRAKGYRLEIGGSDTSAWFRGLKVRAIPKDEEIGGAHVRRW